MTHRSFHVCLDNIDFVTKSLVDLALIQGSTDNISVIVVFLKDPHQISIDAWPSAKIPSLLDDMETAYDNSSTNGASAFNNSNEVCAYLPINFHHGAQNVIFRLCSFAFLGCRIFSKNPIFCTTLAWT